MALSGEEWAELAGEIRWATARLGGAFQPDHINYAFLQNQDRHVHLHVIPRYEQPRTIADVAFDDPDYPGHYTPGVERRVESDVMDSIAAALREDA